MTSKTFCCNKKFCNFPLGLSEENGRLLVGALSTNAYDSQYFPVPRSYLCATESDRSFDMVCFGFVCSGRSVDLFSFYQTYKCAKL